MVDQPGNILLSDVLSRRMPTHEELCHERLGDRFARALSDYDTSRRVEVLVDRFLDDTMIRGKRVLDVGCGLGFFSERLVQRGAEVTACDIGPNLVHATRQRAGCRGHVADVMQLTQYFERESFDVVLSSECIEHVPDPRRAIREMSAVLRPGGYLSLSTPNLLWYPVVKMATWARLRPFDGYERFSSWQTIRKVVSESGMAIEVEFGLHLFPFQIPLHPLSAFCDRRLQRLRRLMINICVLARKLS